MKKEFRLGLEDGGCGELENVKKLCGEKRDGKGIRFGIENYGSLNDRYIEREGEIRRWKDKYGGLNKGVDD